VGTATSETDRREQDLLRRAQDGDESAYAQLTGAYRGELQAHCYRMLGSVHDAEDALQDAMLRAWKALPRFEGRSSFRSWLYRIATNTSLDVIGKRPKRVLPVDYAASDPHEGPGEPILESIWIEPYADRELQIEDGLAGPEARYEQREAVELAFVAALQHLPANQRAVLILREVLGFSAAEVAESLETTTASVNSALQRARKAVDEKLPEQSQQETLRSLGDERVRELVEDYMEAWENQDVDKVLEMLAEDASFTMPPLRTWFSGREEIGIFLRLSPLSGDWRWKPLRVQSNGQEALAFYAWDDGEGAYTRFALNVLTFRGEEICEVDAFIARAPETPDRETVLRMPEQPVDEDAMDAAFERLGLPEKLDRDGSPA
jgi:RNA polymerase sigma-70 factor (ECF subfamily)